MWRVGIDIGGTFTDLVAYNEDTGEIKHLKVLTTPREPWKGFMKALEELGVPIDSVKVIVHATTLGTNMFFGQVGLEPPQPVLITTKGFRDVIEIGRQNRPELYNPYFEKPKPLVPRKNRYTIRGRLDARGNIVEEFDENEVVEIAKKMCRKNVVFVVSILHCYANPEFERRIVRLIREACAEAEEVVGSCDVDSEPGEYERTSTALVNAMLRPLFRRYIAGIVEELRARGFKGKLLVMQSSGGVSEPKLAEEKPALFIESGPAAGAIATAYLASKRRDKLAVGFDMGGTTAKAVLVVDGKPSITHVFEVGGKYHMGRRVRGSGYPVRAPYIDLVEVSAGGGTIAWVDRGGALRVGPQSVGADPGPACYGRGGNKPTITDAHAVLGRLPDKLAGGKLVIRRELALEVYRRLASSLGMDLYDTAESVLRLANMIMARAIRIVTVERGYDPSSTVLYAYGGAGPLHALEMAEELGVRKVVIPPYPGVFSALGLLLADYRHDLYYSVHEAVENVSWEELDAIYVQLEEKAYRLLVSEGVEKDNIQFIRILELRYRGQLEYLEVGWSERREIVVEKFRELYKAKYGYLPPTEPPIELVRLHLIAVGFTAKPAIRVPKGIGDPKPTGYAEALILDEGWVKTPIYNRVILGVGVEIGGPAVIVSEDSTIIVPSKWSGYVAEDGSIVFERR